jgi:NitT/TauT family transport system permease protein
MLIIQFLPVPAFAPVIASMLGYGSATKIFIIVLFTIFPVIITVEKAIASLPENYFSLFKTYSVNKISLYKKMILPAIVPNLLTTLKILTTASFVTSIIAELPLTVSSGIGKDIYNSFNNQVTTRVWASLLLISIFSLAFFYLIVFLEKYILLKYRYGKS